MALILVIEDDESMNQVLVDTLEDEDHEVVSATNGKDALRLLEKKRFDLAVSDVRLPGMDGVETLTLLKKAQPDLKCIIITGYASADTPIRAIRLKVDDYLFKPFSLTYFLNIVNRVLAQEADKAQKFALVEKLFSVFGRSKNDALRDLVAERQEAFRGLYLGTRSGYLSELAAHEVYSSLESLEEQFRGHLNNESPTLPEIRTLTQDYAALGNRIAELELGSTEVQHATAVPKDQFNRLFEAVKSSQIDLDDLQYAPLLRQTPDNRFETYRKLLDLKHRLWPLEATN